MNARERLAAVLAAGVLVALEELIDERVQAELSRRDAEAPRNSGLLTYEQAGKLLDCSPDAVRMRVKRGYLQSRRLGRSVYVLASSIDDLR